MRCSPAGFPNAVKPYSKKRTRLFRFVKTRQNNDGSWFYYDDNGKGNFIDCFHSCFVLKNLVKFGRLTGTDVASTVDNGIDFIMANFVDSTDFLARRFTVAANPSMTRYDLYDQAELLHLLTHHRTNGAGSPAARRGHGQVLPAGAKQFRQPDRHVRLPQQNDLPALGGDADGIRAVGILHGV